MVFVFNNGHVNVDDIAVFQQLLVVRNTVAHHFINRDADRFRETVVAEAGGNGVLLVDDVIITDAVELARADARLDVRLDHFQHFCGQFARNAHFFNFFRSLQ